ncbi:ArnT family glycosyltransferase [Hyphobacterium marinum]|uniref:Glycosyltransferase family 39 protein n=1 Tax=Hyphobacterium marinum TaxID=3116574 RepID=A0ABU7LVZ8_9PROT|nr:glycosyltransferase family 39 protein [Hyphobacterium sp. Y6023]MEE2565733.1 glycosyltransferase family 39 protein [Hyphobacterium sp. Y6023]
MSDSTRTALHGPIGPVSWTQATALLILAATAVRIVALAISPVELYPDESQYWVWSHQFDWGYFSKPPMIAWLIGSSTAIFGVSDFAIRLPASLLHALTATFLALTTRRIAGNRAGFWAALVYLTTPAVFLSSGVISTDAVLMMFWSCALYALIRLRGGAGLGTAAALGLSIGLGFLSKYAMIYFVVGTGLAVLLDPPARRALISLKGLLATALAIALVTPNLLWNAANDFATLQHTADNANWGADLFHFAEMADFVLAQLGVFGPALFPILMVAAFGALRGLLRADGDPLRLLALYVLPALLVVTAQAFISRAHANWAAASYVAGTVLVTFFLLSGPAWRRYVLYGSVAVSTAAGLIFMAMALQPRLADDLGWANAFKRVRGWETSATAIADAANGAGYDALLFDDRNVFHQMQRYGGAIEPPLYMWQRYGGAHNHADMTWPLPDGYEGRVLVVSERPLDTPRIRDDFQSFETAGEITIPLGGGRERHFTLWRARGYDRVARTQAYEARWSEIDAETLRGER